MIINDLDDYYIVFDTKNRNTELDTLVDNLHLRQHIQESHKLIPYAYKTKRKNIHMLSMRH